MPRAAAAAPTRPRATAPLRIRSHETQRAPRGPSLQCAKRPARGQRDRSSLRKGGPPRRSAGSRLAWLTNTLLVAGIGLQCSGGKEQIHDAMEPEAIALLASRAYSRVLGAMLPLRPRYNGSFMVRFEDVPEGGSGASAFIREHFRSEDFDRIRRRLQSGRDGKIPRPSLARAEGILDVKIARATDDGTPHFSLSKFYWSESEGKGICYQELMDNSSEGSGWLLILERSPTELRVVDQFPVFF